MTKDLLTKEIEKNKTELKDMGEKMEDLSKLA